MKLLICSSWFPFSQIKMLHDTMTQDVKEMSKKMFIQLWNELQCYYVLCITCMYLFVFFCVCVCANLKIRI